MTFVRTLVSKITGETTRKAVLERLALAAALSMLFYRFANLDLVPFILDEPSFLSGARQQITTGHWVTASPLVGTQGITYGPTVLWFYGIVHWLFGSRALIHIVAMAVNVTIAHFALCLGLGRALGGGLVGLATITAFVASSPYQFFWSRLAWDQTVNACTAWSVALLCAPGPFRVWRSVALGAILGLAISSHLMVLPFVAIAVVWFVVRAWRNGIVKQLASLTFAMVAVNVPYIRFWIANQQHLQPTVHSFAEIPRFMIEPVRVMTLWESNYFFDHLWSEFLRVNPVYSPSLTVGVLWLVATLAVVGLAVNLLRARGLYRPARFAALAWAGCAALYGYRALVPHPHYQFATWWVVPVGLAGLLAWAQRTSSSWSKTVVTAIWCLSLFQFGYVVRWMQYIRAHGGTPSIHYGTPLAAQTDAVRQACSAPQARIVLENQTAVFAQSLYYAASTEEACAGKSFQVCAPGTCFGGDAGARHYSLRYAAPHAGALTLE